MDAALDIRRATAAQLLHREVEIERALELQRARSNLLPFIMYTMRDYRPSWHHVLLASTLDQVVEGRIKRLIVTMPPRHGKTENVSIRFPAYVLGRYPDTQILAASYNADYAKKINRGVQRCMDTPEYADVFPGTRLNGKSVRTVHMSSVRNTDEFEVVGRKGFYKCSGVGGALTGYGANIAICDDFCKNYDDAKSPVLRERLWDWWVTTFSTRLQPGAAAIICATRWHEDELIGRILEQQRKNPELERWTVLNLPAIAEDPVAGHDPRQVGEALWPQRFGLKYLQQKRADGERAFVSMYQQRPSPQEGNIVQTGWWRFYDHLPAQDVDLMIASCDLNLVKRDTSDFTAITIWARIGPDFYAIDCVHERMGWPEQKRALKRIAKSYPELDMILIESAGSGEALEKELKETMSGVKAIIPRGSKIARLEAVSGLIECGNVLLPQPNSPGNDWAQKIVDEMAVFPNGKNDDLVDSVSMALGWLKGRTSALDVMPGMVEREKPAYGQAAPSMVKIR